MASGSNSANSNSSNNAKEQLLVCWLEPQSDAGKVSAIPPSWIVSTVSGDGRSPNSIVRCRWPRTKRLYRARIVSSADQQTKSVQDENEEEEEEESGNESVDKRTSKEEPTLNDEPAMVASANMVKEETKTTRNSQAQQSPAPMAQVSVAPTSQPSALVAPAAPVPQPPVIDAAAIAQALLPTLKKLFNNELNKLSTDIQANFDIIGHKISALDGTVKCIKTRVDRMETLLNTAAQELGDNQTSAPSNSNINSLSLSSIGMARSSPLNNADLLTGAARGLSVSSIGQNNANVSGGFYAAQQQNRTPVVSNAPSRYSATSNTSASARNSMAAAASQALNAQLQQQRRQVAGSSRFGNQPAQSLRTTPAGCRPSANAAFVSFSRQTPNSMVSVSSAQRPQIPGNSASGSTSSKRRRTTPTTNPPLPKAVVITAPNGIDIYLGGDKNYKMPLVMYKDALKNCTRPIATYMVMALIRRYLTPDEMSRTWLTEQQLLGKKDGILLDQNLLNALKKQALMQFPGSGIDDRLLVRKLYDVFHGIRRQMRKKRREAGDAGYGQGSLLSGYGNDQSGVDSAGLGDNAGDDDSGSGNEHEEGIDYDSHNLEQGSGGYDDDEQANEFEGEEHGPGDLMENEEQLQEQEEGEDDGGLMGNGVLNGDEDLEEMAAKQAAFWAGADDTY